MRDFQDCPSFRFQDAPKTFQPAYDETYRNRDYDAAGPGSSSFFHWSLKNSSEEYNQPPTLTGDLSPQAETYFPGFEAGNFVTSATETTPTTSITNALVDQSDMIFPSFSDQYFDVEGNTGGVYNNGKSFFEPIFSGNNLNVNDNNAKLPMPAAQPSDQQPEAVVDFFPSFPSFQQQNWTQDIYQYQEMTPESSPMKQLLSSTQGQQPLETMPSTSGAPPTSSHIPVSTSSALDKIIDECFAETFTDHSEVTQDYGNFATDFDTWFLGPWVDGKASPPSQEVPESIQCRWKDCTYSSICQETLVNHIQKNHVDQRNPSSRTGPPAPDSFVCHWEGCPRQGRAFNARYKLLIHMRVHSGEKPNKCTYPSCDKAFSRLENLKIHMRSHTGERPYVCQYPGCKKAFSNSSDRAKHQRTHLDSKPYACPSPGCGKKYTDPSSLRKHSKHHQENHSRTGRRRGRKNSYASSGRVKRERTSSASASTSCDQTQRSTSYDPSYLMSTVESESIYYARSCSTPSGKPLSLAGFFNEVQREDEVDLMDSCSHDSNFIMKRETNDLSNYPVMMTTCCPTSPPASPTHVSSCSSSLLNYQDQNKLLFHERQRCLQ